MRPLATFWKNKKMAEPRRPRVAVVATVYRPHSHADVCAGKLLNVIPSDSGPQQPQLDVVSIWLDQPNDRGDISAAVCAQHGVPRCNSIREALMLGGSELAVDAVLILGEVRRLALSFPTALVHARRSPAQVRDRSTETTRTTKKGSICTHAATC